MQYIIKEKVRFCVWEFIVTGKVNSRIGEILRKPGTSEEEFQTAYNKLQPLGHVGETNDIAYGVLYLASDESKFVTATELIIDGGIYGGRLFN